MANYNGFIEVIKQVASAQIDGRVPAGCTRAKLVKLDPLTFQITAQLHVYGQFLVTPKHKVFRPADVGRDYVFWKDAGGQTYYYLYEPASPQGANGVPYSFKGTFEGTLHGTCPDGAVTVTQGTITSLTHEEEV